MSVDADLPSLLGNAINAARAGDRKQAYQLLRQVIAADPSNEAAWLWFAVVADQPREARLALRRVERLNPNNPRLAEARRWLESRWLASPGSVAIPALEAPAVGATSEPSAVSTSRDTKPIAVVRPLDELPDAAAAPPAGDADTTPVQAVPPQAPARFGQRAGRLILTTLIGLALLVALALLGLALWLRSGAGPVGSNATTTPDRSQRSLALLPQLNAAIAGSQWGEAVAVLETMHEIDPASAPWLHSGANAYYHLAVRLRQAGDLRSAAAALDKSLRLAPDMAPVRQEQ